MDAPFPVQINENINSNIDLTIESNLKNKFYVEIKNDSKKFLMINIITINKIPSLRYEEKFELNTIKNISKYFSACKSISDIISSIKTNIKKSDLIEINKKIKLIIKTNHPTYKEIIFQIPQKEAKEYNQSELFYLILDFKKTFIKQQTIIEKQQKDINELKEKVKTLENDIKNIKKYDENNVSLLNINKEIEEIKEKEDDFENSYILYEESKIKVVKFWINPNKKIRFKLLFKMLRDGDSSKYFHKYCDNQGPTLTLVETSRDYIFGGYTPYNWESNEINGPYDDKETFVFSLNSMEKFNKIREGSCIFTSKHFGPCFGKKGSDFYITNNLKCGYISNGNFLQNYELTQGESGEFKISGLEVFKVIFLN